ncbi:MAG TPA: hypothetical protein VMV83_01545 [Rectinemataceae bacterium]|nr:hypothetical protein [Rectinemataceae bacterium]
MRLRRTELSERFGQNPDESEGAEDSNEGGEALRGARYDNYHVQEFADGRIILEPGEIVAPFELSAKTLATMDESMKNLKMGKVSKPIDLSAFADK